MRLLKLVKTVLSLEHSPIPKTQLFALLGFAAATVILAPLIPDPDPDYYHSDYVSPTAADADDDKIFDKIHNSRMRYLELTANDSGTDEDIPDDSPDLIDSEFADDDIENIFQDAFSKDGEKEQKAESGEDENELDWLDYTVKEDDNLSTIFNTLNLSQKTLFMLLKTDQTKTLTRLKIGQKLHFLIDRNGTLLSLAISMFSSENEIIYVYDSKNDRYISYTDPAGTYEQADLERLVKEPQTDPATYAQSDTDSAFTDEEIKEYEKDEEKAEAEEEAARAKEEQEKAEKEKAEKEKAEKEKTEKEKAEKEKAEKEKAEKEKAEKEKAEKETAKEKAEKEKAEKEKAAKEKAEKEKAAKEKAEKEAKEKAAREKAEKEKAEKEKAEKERIARENAEKVQREMEKQQRIEEAKRSSNVLMGTITRGVFITDAKKAGLTSAHISRIIKIYKGKINFRRDLRKGDSFRVLFDRPSGDKNARIMAVSFTSGGKTIALYRAKNGMFYPENGVSPTVSRRSTGSGWWRYPMPNNTKVSSPFNPHRWHPIRGIYRPHYGTDFTAPIGTKVYAPANGTVLKTSYQRGGAGYYIIIKHTGGYSTVYMHLSKALVRTGQQVSQGQVIALSGNTGGSTGPHLHYEVRINGRAVDAMRVDLPGGSSRESVSIDWNASKEFAKDVGSYKSQLSRAVVIDESNADRFLKSSPKTEKAKSGNGSGRASSSQKKDQKASASQKSNQRSSASQKKNQRSSASQKKNQRSSASQKKNQRPSASQKNNQRSSASQKKGSSGKSSSRKAQSNKKNSGSSGSRRQRK